MTTGMDLDSILLGWNPPCPNHASASSSTTTTTNISAGVDYFYSGDTVHTFNVDCQRLLYLVKSFDKYKNKHKNKKRNNDDEDNDDNHDDMDETGRQQQHQQQRTSILFDEITILMKKMIAYYTRRGRVLFLASSSSGSSSGNNHAPTTTTTSGESGKQRSKNANNNNAKNIDVFDHENNESTATTSSSSSSDCDNLLCLAMIRIFNSSVTIKEEDETQEEALLEEYNLHLIELCSELCIALCQKIQMQQQQHYAIMDANWNNEIFTKFGKPILSCVVQTMKRMFLLANSKSNGNNNNNNSNNTIIIGPLLGCLKVSTLLLDTFRTKYGRSFTILSELYDLTWSTCCSCGTSNTTIHHDAIQRVSATLIATLPLCGYNYTNNTYNIPGNLKGSSSSSHTFSSSSSTTTPSDIWNSTMKDVLWSLSTVFHAMAPTISKGTTMTTNINKTRNHNNDPNISSSSSSTNYMRSVIQTWINTLENNNSNPTEQRQTVICNALHKCFTGLTYCYRSLLAAQTTTTTTKSLLIGARMDVTSVLDIVEAFLSFPLSAESLYYRTKKRLRMEVVGTGGGGLLLSPHSIAIYLASKMKQVGHVILDCTINSLGGSILLPYSRRILRICYAAVLTSSSYPVRSLVDPSNLRNTNNNVAAVAGSNTNSNNNKPVKRKWLHTSIFLRTKAIQTFQYVSLTFGSDSGSNSSKKRNKSKPTTNSSISHSNQHDGLMMIDSNCSDGERTILLIAGCLVEQLNWNGGGGGGGVAAIDDDDWGSLSERVDLAQKATEALTACLVSWGGFMSPPARSLIDSIATTGLSKICLINYGSSIALGWSAIKVAMLRLASACLTTPYPDGASSSICDLLTNAAKKCAMDCNCDVAVAARTALRVCDEAAVPRGVAIEYTTRIVASTAGDSLTSPASVLNQTIQSARADIMESEKAKTNQEAATPKPKRNKSPHKERTSKGMPDETQSRKKPKTISHEEPVVSKPSVDEKKKTEVLPTDNARSQIVGESYPIEARSPEDNNTDDARPNDSMDMTEHQNETQKLSGVARNSETESEGDDDFPDIVDGGGPDSDDD